MMNESEDNVNYKVFSLRQLILILVGLAIVVITLIEFHGNWNAFFNLTVTPGNEGYGSVSTFFLIGLLLFVVGLFDVLRTVYFIRTIKKNRKK